MGRLGPPQECPLQEWGLPLLELALTVEITQRAEWLPFSTVAWQQLVHSGSVTLLKGSQSHMAGNTLFLL